MLPDNWPGRAARELCGRLYWRVFDASEAHLDALAARDNERYTPLTADGALRRPARLIRRKAIGSRVGCAGRCRVTPGATDRRIACAP